MGRQYGISTKSPVSRIGQESVQSLDPLLVSYKLLSKVNILSPSSFICNMSIKLSTSFDNVYEVPNIGTCI